MKKTGFTLAEVLITLTVIGIVAAITLPSLSTNVQKSQIGPTLAKAVNTLENANRLALQQYETRSLQTAIDSLGANKTYIDLLETQVAGAVGSSTNTYISKDGVSYILDSTTATGNNTLTNKYHNKAYKVTIDTNGAKNPNEGGEDQFNVLVDYAGTVIPVGGNEYKKYMGGATTITTCAASNASENCTGNIADNGWKVVW